MSGMVKHLTLLCFDPQTVVPGNRNNAMLQSLLPDTPYNITVAAIYAEGHGGTLNGNGRTGEETTDDLLNFLLLGCKSHTFQKFSGLKA